MLIESVLKVATPLAALTVVVPDSVPLDGFVPIAITTLAVLVVRLSEASRSRTVTAGVIVINPKEAKFYAEKGARYIVFSSDKRMNEFLAPGRLPLMFASNSHRYSFPLGAFLSQPAGGLV